MILQNIISQSNNSNGTVYVNTAALILEPDDLTPTSFYWLNAFKTSDFPGCTIDTDYFFLYSTNHDVGDGGIYIGKGDNLNLSDFTEMGLIFDGYQAETPKLYYDASHARPIHLYYHTDASDPANGGIQRTRLKTTAGGDLLTSTWTQEASPLGSESGDQHTGYFNFWNNGTDLIGIHYKKGINEVTGFEGEQQYSTYDGAGTATWTRGGLCDTTSFLETDRLAQLSLGGFFKKYGQWWWVGLTRSFPLTTPLSKIILCKANSNFEITEFITELYNPASGSPQIYINGDVMHIYFSNNTTGIYYAPFDLTQLANLI